MHLGTIASRWTHRICRTRNWRPWLANGDSEHYGARKTHAAWRTNWSVQYAIALALLRMRLCDHCRCWADWPFCSKNQSGAGSSGDRCLTCTASPSITACLGSRRTLQSNGSAFDLQAAMLLLLWLVMVFMAPSKPAFLPLKSIQPCCQRA